MPNVKVSQDVERISKFRKELASDDNVTRDGLMVHAVLEVAYQLAMLRGDVADLIDEERKS